MQIEVPASAALPTVTRNDLCVVGMRIVR